MDCKKFTLRESTSTDTTSLDPSINALVPQFKTAAKSNTGSRCDAAVRSR